MNTVLFVNASTVFSENLFLVKLALNQRLKYQKQMKIK